MLVKGRIALSFGLRGARGKPKKSEQTEFDKIQVFYEYISVYDNIMCDMSGVRPRSRMDIKTNRSVWQLGR